MLAKRNRVTRADFATYFKTGRRHNFRDLTIVYTPKDTFAASVVVSKKVSTRAVKRNAIRRRVYDTLRRTFKDADTRGVYIVVVKPSFQTLTRTFQRATIIESVGQVIKST